MPPFVTSRYSSTHESSHRGHGTGWRAAAALATAFSPARCAPSVVYTRHVLTAP